MDEKARAISFANNYFALADGLASGLEEHLAENVILDWFGRTVRGRRNVGAFIGTRKVNSRHVFDDIVPVDVIGYDKCPTNRANYASSCLADSPIAQEERKIGSGLVEINNNEADDVATKIIAREVDDVDDQDDLRTYDIDVLFARHYDDASVAEIRESVDRMKLTEAKESRRRGDFAELDVDGVKYVQAHGQIEFSRKSESQGIWEPYSYLSVTSGRTWRRSCKLQIAYTVAKSSTRHSSKPRRPRASSNVPRKPYDAPRRRLPTLEEIGETSARLIASTERFTAWLRSADVAEERNEFLDRLRSEIFGRGVGALSPRYVGNRLVIEKPTTKTTTTRRDVEEVVDDQLERSFESRRPFVFNYRIHVIVYEGDSRCRVNLMDKFDSPA